MTTIDEKKKRAEELVTLVEKLDEKDIKLLSFGAEMLQARKIFEGKSNNMNIYTNSNN